MLLASPATIRFLWGDFSFHPGETFIPPGWDVRFTRVEQMFRQGETLSVLDTRAMILWMRERDYLKTKIIIYCGVLA